MKLAIMPSITSTTKHFRKNETSLLFEGTAFTSTFNYFRISFTLKERCCIFINFLFKLTTPSIFIIVIRK